MRPPLLLHRPRLLRRLRRDGRGTAIMEFALTAPVFLLLLMGIFDYCWQLYTQQILYGAMGDAGRAATLQVAAAPAAEGEEEEGEASEGEGEGESEGEGSTPAKPTGIDMATLDEMVRTRVKQVMPNATVEFTRRSYQDFAGVGKREPLRDDNGNGQHDDGECFEDINGNGVWDADQGVDGSGGADDIVLYTATVSFSRVLPVWKMLGQSQHTELRASTVLRNQPYATRAEREIVRCEA
ncbi:MAG: pilus assembly protein TadE [Alphaproteobacteria bacterium HGW-Alphaproteobacteria-13]|nr:MAG: pilus assembly protein TadE [Alphaproteobacteria bacterium HGW-Alphaproteobacteria-13]